VADRVTQNEPAAELKPTGSVCLTPRMIGDAFS
jgi:hypothetical protein